MQSAGIVFGLCFTALAFRPETKSRQAENLIRITENHRALWTRFEEHPELERVLDPAPDLAVNPITPEEARFVQFVILHLHTTFQLAKGGLYRQPDTIADDVRSLLGLPLPNSVWKALKPFQDKDFVAFIEATLRSPHPPATPRHRKPNDRAPFDGRKICSCGGRDSSPRGLGNVKAAIRA